MLKKNAHLSHMYRPVDVDWLGTVKPFFRVVTWLANVAVTSLGTDTSVAIATGGSVKGCTIF